MKKIISLLATLVIATSVSGCATQSPEQAALAMFDSLPQVCQPYNDGALAKSVNVVATSGIPNVTFKPGLAPKKPQVHEVVAGTGATFKGNQTVVFEIAAFNGETGKAYPESSGFVTKFNGTNAVTTLATDSKDAQVNLCAIFAGRKVGSRVAGVFPIKGSSATSKDSSIVLVLDLVNVFLPRSSGSEQSAVSGIPAAVRDKNGVPGLIFPSNAPAPTEFKEYTAVKGAGAPLKKGDHILVHYKLYLWDSAHTMVQSSWDNQPLDITLGTGTIEGFTKALAGQTIGSEVVAVIPPGLGYGATAQQSIPANSTLVFVIDILGKY